MEQYLQFIAWFWLGLAVLLVVLEIFTAGFVLFWFGIGAAVAGVLALLKFSFIWQILAFVVVSGALVPFSRRFAEKVTGQQPPGIGADRLIDKKGIVIEEIDNLKPTGRVRVDRDEWRADSADNTVIPEGTKINVVRVEGTRLIVEKIAEEEA